MLQTRPTPALWQRTVSAIMGTALLLGALLLVLAALAVGLLLACGFVLWALLRGRRPRLSNVRWSHVRGSRGFARPAAPEVIDVQAREVPPGPTPR
jgi:membrane protease YdiL (CAAX protease family)